MDESIVPESVVFQEAPMELPEVLQEPTSSKHPLFLVLYGVANMVIGIGNITLATVLLPRQIASMVSGNQTGTFALIVGLGAVAAVLTNPLVGMLSDRTTSRFGRRRSWLVAGGVLTVVAVLLLSIASSLLLVVVEWIFLEIAINLVQAALTAILPDQVPVRQRATVSAFAAGLGTLLGGLFGQILVAQVFKEIQAAYTSIAVTIVIMLALFLLVLREVPLSREHVPPFRIKHILAAYWLDPLANRDLFLTWLARCLMFLGYTTVVNFMFYYLQDAVQYVRVFPGQTTAQGVQTFFAINVGSILVASLFGGMLSDKMQRRRPFVIVASLIMTVGLLLYAFFPTWAMVIVATVVLGLGMGIFLAVDLALASQVLPKAADRGKDMGIINTAIFLPMILSPIIAGVTLSALHSYLALFSLLAVATLFSAILIVPIKSVC
ncbi:MAG: MFS transporter [Ktedonobacteraceae bacterium]